MTCEKRKDRSGHEGTTSRSSHPVHRCAGLEEASGLNEERRAKRRPSARVEWDEDQKGNDTENEDDTSRPVFCRANAVEANDLSDPATFEGTVGGPDQNHWRKAIRAELESMRLRGMF